VIIHIDEPSDLIMKSKNVTGENSGLINQIKKIVSSYKEVQECSDINIIDSENKLRISLVCIFPEEFSFRQVHRLVHKMESDIYGLSEDISNVMIHAEPLTIINEK
jgi:divalent metal cation (Fe/Co/Zn/Cd) transporter